jgi:predicted kinase
MDCIEFNERLRFGDIASDVAFLAMDLEFRGRRMEADEFISLYLEAMGGDETLPAMLNFYRVYRAFIRGKVDSMLSEELEVPDEQRAEARRRAQRYFDLAASIAKARTPQAVVVMAGLSGTGKSFAARGVAARIGAVLLSTDAIRREDGGAAPAAYGEAGYTDEQRERVYTHMFERAGEHLARKRSVVLDATFLSRRHRARASDLAASAHAPILFAQTTAPDDVVRQRLALRSGTSSVSDARWDTYLGQRDRFEPFDATEAARLVILDSSRQLDQLVDGAVNAIPAARRALRPSTSGTAHR